MGMDVTDACRDALADAMTTRLTGGDGARDGAARPPNPAEAIVRNLMRAFPNAVFALVCPELPAAADELGFVVRHQCPLGQSAVWVLVPPSEPVTSQG